VNCHVEEAEQSTCGWQLAAAFLELTTLASSAFLHLYVDWKNLFFSFSLNKKNNNNKNQRVCTILIGIWLSSGRHFSTPPTPFFLSSVDDY
jgi:hypothetical protein